MKKYGNFILEIKEIEEREYGSVGIVFIFNNKVLLVRSVTGEWSYPKGKYEEGETFEQAAIREVNEELNLNLPTTLLENQTYYEIPTQTLTKYGVKHYYYYIYELTPEEFQLYFNSDEVIKKDNLDQNEIVKAKFFTKKEGKKVIKNKFKPIFAKIKELKKVTVEQ